MDEQTIPGPLPPAQLAGIPRLYANGIAVGYSKTECVLTFLFGSEAQIAVVLPFPFAKALSEQITLVLADFENRSGIKVPHPDEIIVEGKGSAPKVESKPART